MEKIIAQLKEKNPTANILTATNLPDGVLIVYQIPKPSIFVEGAQTSQTRAYYFGTGQSWDNICS
jgi:hypothetical protein